MADWRKIRQVFAAATVVSNRGGADCNQPTISLSGVELIR
jgi:hypothetical protein